MKRIGGSTTSHTTMPATYRAATAASTTNIHPSGSTAAAMANGTKQHRNTTVSQMASLMRHTFFILGFSWFAGRSLMNILRSNYMRPYHTRAPARTPLFYPACNVVFAFT